MRTVRGNDAIFDQMIRGKDEIVYNLIFSRREAENTLLLTDDHSCIITQSREPKPVVVFLNGHPDRALEFELVQQLSNQLKKTGKLRINAKAEYIRDTLECVSTMTGIPYSINRTFNAYACFSVKQPIKQGKLVVPEREYRKNMARLFCEMQYDDGHVLISEEEADAFADKMVNSNSLFLWKDGDIVSMAKIAHKSRKYARIDTVVTERKMRGKGYAGMLVAEVSDMLLHNHLTPMLYTDASYPSSNQAYQKIGYEKQGEIMEFIF